MSEKTLLASARPDWLLRSLFIAASVFAVLCVVLLVILAPAAGGLLVLTLVVANVFGFMVGRLGTARREGLLWALALAAERGMPLASALEALSGQHSGRYRAQLLALAGLLKSGVPLPEALAMVPGTLPRDAETVVAVGWDTGCLAGVLREAAESQALRRPIRAAVAARATYLLAVFVAMQLIAAFLMYFVIPKFEAIFKDFDVPLPPATIIAITLSHMVMSWAGPVLAFMVLGEVALSLGVPFVLAGSWGWSTPGIDRLMIGKHSATILRTLAWVVDAGRPLRWGVATLAWRYPSAWVRYRLEQVLQDLDAGADCWASLEGRGLIRPVDRALLDAARRAGNLSWTLRETAEGRERRLDYRLHAWTQVLSVPVLVGLGVVVLLFTVAYFTPLLTLIERLSG